MGRKVGFIGGGNMAGAIIGGIVRTGAFPAGQIAVYDRHREKREALSEKTGVRTAQSESELAAESDIVFLAVKPQNFPEVLAKIRPVADAGKVFVSIAAGVTSKSILEGLGCACPVIRAMPNTPLLIGKGATAICRTENVPEDCFRLVRSFFSSCGIVETIEEEQMNAVISVNGSSPAYVYLLAKAMADSAVGQGIDGKTALSLICQTLEGSAGMLRLPEYTPEALIDMVSSKGGTTVEALQVLRRRDFESTVDEAMKACTKRAVELGE